MESKYDQSKSVMKGKAGHHLINIVSQRTQIRCFTEKIL